MNLYLQVRNLQKKKQSLNANDILSNLKVRVNNKLIIGNLKINSIAGKFDQLKLMAKYKVDILVLDETKIDSLINKKSSRKFKIVKFLRFSA